MSPLLKPIYAVVLLLALTAVLYADEVSITHDGKTLKGTLVAIDEKPSRIAFIISGSGPTDRDGNTVGLTGKNNSLKYLSDFLNKKGISTLRIDKRGVAGSAAASIQEKDLRFSIYVDDIGRWIKLLEKKDYQEIYLIGHSEGALIATMAAAKNPKVTKLVSLAGAGFSAPVVLRKQLKTNLPAALYEQADEIITSLSNGSEVKDPPPSLNSLFRPSVQPYLISWFCIDPAVEIGKLKIPTLILQGTTDLQISTEDVKRLHKNAPQSQLKMIEGMNHVLKQAKGDLNAQLPSYLNPDLPLHPDLGSALVKFLK